MGQSLITRGLWLCGWPLLLGLVGCGEDSLRNMSPAYTPRERYEQALHEVGLDQTALGRDWLLAASTALDRAIEVTAPYREESYLDAREATASAYRISLRRGQRLQVAFESQPDSAYRVFIELFVTRKTPGATPRYVTAVDSLERELDYLVRRDGDYLVRVQPELLRGGRYAIDIVLTPSLRFPVAGRDTTAIGSLYGDSRDAGRRSHEGLDIFAPRGTPVLAAANGVVRSTRRNNLGGNVVWLRDEFDRTHYYAHLDSQAVRRGDRVQAGDTIGFVGNTGNARTTPPHLHFGIYARGSFDPYPALRELPITPASFTGDRALIGKTVRVNREESRVRRLPSRRSDVLAELSLHTPLLVEAGAGGWYRVTLPDGTSGFVAVDLTELAESPIRSELVTDGAILLTDPAATAVTLEIVDPGAELPVLGAYGEFLYVQGASGRVGWLRPD